MEVLLVLNSSAYNISCMHEAYCISECQPTHCANDWTAQKCPPLTITPWFFIWGHYFQILLPAIYNIDLHVFFSFSHMFLITTGLQELAMGKLPLSCVVGGYHEHMKKQSDLMLMVFATVAPKTIHFVLFELISVVLCAVVHSARLFLAAATINLCTTAFKKGDGHSFIVCV